MKRSRDSLKILLLQTRRAETVRVEERESFAEHAGLRLRQVEVLDAFKTPVFDESCLAGYDALFVGGASEASVLQPDRYPLVKSGEALLRHCIDIDFPVLASCFGFQMAVIALGGNITRDEDDFEFGTLPIDVTAEGEADLLFRDQPRRFLAVAGHKEKAVELPEECVLLAKTDVCTHAFRVEGSNFWATQFHPELDKQRLIERLEVYKTQYMETDDHHEAAVADFLDTPESNLLLKKFVDRVLLGG